MKSTFYRLLPWVLFGVVLHLYAPAAWADTLPEALSRAYLGNPTLNAERAGQRATDEQVPQALSGWRPSVTVAADAQRIEGTQKNRTSFCPGDALLLPLPCRSLGDGTLSLDENPGTLAIVLSQPVFRGFGTVNSTKAAEATVRAGQQNLLATEQNVLFSAVQAYMDVYSGRQLVALQQDNVVVLRGQLDATNARFEVGEVTRTDVAQSRASLSEAQAALANQQAILAGDVATYEQVIGNSPGKLKFPKIAQLPKSLESAYAIAGEINPNILAAAFVEDAAYHNIGVQRAPLLPEVFLQAEAFVRDELRSNEGTRTESAVIGGYLTVPLYEAGLVYSRVREAKQLASQRRIEIIEVGRAVRQAVAASWNAYVALGRIISAAKDQVEAERLALDGVRQEYEAGTRTTLDVLDAQQNVVIAQTTLVNAERNRVVAAYQLIAAVGRLTAGDLRLNVPYYDPEDNYLAVRNKWIGTDAKTIE